MATMRGALSAISAQMHRLTPRWRRGKPGRVLDFRPAARTAVGRQLLGEGFEPEVAQLLTDLSLKGAGGRSIFIDVGANIGYFPLLVRHRALRNGCGIDCYAHEPLPALFEIAQRLQVWNGIDYVLSPVALSDFVGSAKFYVSSQSDSSSSLCEGFRRAREIIEVEVSTLDHTYATILRDGAYDEILIKIDVETAEPAVLRGGAEILRRFRPVIICEVLAGRTESALAEIFDAADYNAFRYDGAGWVQERRVFGDATYKYRDWLFVPGERRNEFLDFLAVPRLMD